MNSNDEQQDRCRQCGAPLTGELPEQLCGACMMKLAIEPSPSEQPALMETLESESPPAKVPSVVVRKSSQSAASGDLIGGQSFGDYTIVRRLGRGGMGTVYEADHRPSGRRVALKILAHSLDNPQARARFLREGRLAASINHPNSVYVFGTEQIGDTPTISMELIRGGTLQQWVRERGQLEISVAVDAVLQIIDGLEAADRKGVLHRDVKPANCFIDPSGIIKVGDFGLSVSTGPRNDSITNVTCEGTFLGTPAFASPEQLRGEPLDRRSDIYSVGVTLFYLLTGQAPFSGGNMVQLLATVLDKQPPSVCSIREDVPDEVDAVIQRCLQKSAGQRFADYDSLREMLLPHSSTKPIPAALGNRVVANVIDFCLLSVIATLATFAIQFFVFGHMIILPMPGAEHPFYSISTAITMYAFQFLYYAVSEWRIGKTFGKHLLGLRVTDGDQRISWWQACTRAAIFVFIPNVPSIIYSITYRDMSFQMMQETPIQWIGMAVALAYYVLMVGMFVTARRRNGYAGIHDLVSGTRVVCKPQTRSRPAESSQHESFDRSESDEKIGPYYLLRVLWEGETDRLILGYDAKLLRRVWLHQQPVGAAEVDAAARNMSRISRLRWLGARRTDTESWDCYEAPTGKQLSQAIDDGLGWEARISALRQLAYELNKAVEDETLPENPSLEHLWITEDETLKLLPLAPESNGDLAEAGARPESREPSEVALALMHQAAKHVYDHSSPLPAGDQHGCAMPLGVHQSLRRVCGTSTLQEAIGRLDSLAHYPSINLRRRSTGLLAASLAVPAFAAATCLMAGLAMRQQKSKMPRVAELGELSTLLDIESRVNHPEKKERIRALETHIAANYRDVLEDDQKMNSFYAMLAVPLEQRESMERLMMREPPTREQAAAAKEAAEKIQAEEGRTIFTADVIFFAPQMFPFIACVAWIEAIWIPSLMTALIFGGGALLWMSGLCLVNRRGQRASRLRVFIRMLIGGLPAFMVVVVFFATQIGFQPIDWLVVWIIAVAVVLIAVVTRRRLLHDRIAGTYLVAR